MSEPWQQARKAIPNFANTNSTELYKLLIDIITRLERIENRFMDPTPTVLYQKGMTFNDLPPGHIFVLEED